MPSMPRNLLANARRLRRDATSAEELLWSLVRNRHLGGAKFRRQHPVAGYILDFYCHEARLCVELDGDQHAEPEHAYRDHALEANGIRVLRFANREALRETEVVLEQIWRAVTGAYEDWT